MKQKPLVSIITAVLNGKEYLEGAIKSVISQTYSNYEYIIIDGASKDGTLDIIKKYENKLTSWVSEPDNGISDALNKGILKVKGEIIGLLHYDDWYEKNALEIVVEAFKNPQIDVFCGASRFWKKDKIINVATPDINRIERETSVHHSSVFIKKEIYELNGLFLTKYKYAMDYELLLRYYLRGVKFQQIPLILSNRRLDGISYKNKNKALFETLQIRKKYFPHRIVYVHFLYIWIKDSLGRIMKLPPFLKLYQYYWKKKNLTQGFSK